MKRFFIALLLAPLCGAFLLAPVQAQKTKAQLNTEVNTTFPDNTTGQITPSGVRTFQSDVINSIMPTAPVVNGNFACFNGTTGLLQDCGSSPSTPVQNGNIAPGPANTVKGTLTGVTTTDLSMPSCATDGRHAYTYTAGVGFVCAVISPVSGLIPTTATVTITINSPAVVTWSNHGLADNAVVYFCTTSALPTGLAPCVPANGSVDASTLNANPTLYYVVPGSQTTNTFQVSATLGGTAVNTTGSQSGTQTAFANAYAPSGSVGELIFKSTEITNANVTNGADTVYATVSLSSGIWRVGGSAGVIGTPVGSSTAVFDTNHATLAINKTTICSVPYCGAGAEHVTANTANGYVWTFDPRVIQVYSTSSLQATCEPHWTGTGTPTATCYGNVWAERVR